MITQRAESQIQPFCLFSCPFLSFEFISHQDIDITFLRWHVGRWKKRCSSSYNKFSVNGKQTGDSDLSLHSCHLRQVSTCSFARSVFPWADLPSWSFSPSLRSVKHFLGYMEQNHPQMTCFSRSHRYLSWLVRDAHMSGVRTWRKNDGFVVLEGNRWRGVERTAVESLQHPFSAATAASYSASREQEHKMRPMFRSGLFWPCRNQRRFTGGAVHSILASVYTPSF